MAFLSRRLRSLELEAVKNEIKALTLLSAHADGRIQHGCYQQKKEFIKQLI